MTRLLSVGYVAATTMPSIPSPLPVVPRETTVITPTDDNCNTSPTTINGGQTVCSGTVIFEENFDGILTEKWQKEVKIPIDSAVNININLKTNCMITQIVLYTIGRICIIPRSR